MVSIIIIECLSVALAEGNNTVMTAYVFLIVDKKRESLQQFTLQTLSLVVWIVSYEKQKDLSRR